VNNPKVILVGGGYGGTALVKALAAGFDLTIIERKETFFHAVGALRSVVNRAWPKKLFVPYDRLLPGRRVVRGALARVEKNHILLDDGRKLEFDYLVLGTGVNYPFPGNAPADEVARSTERYQALFEQIEQAKNVLIAGGGPVGAELAGEISSVYRDKKITLVHRGAHLMGAPFNPALGQSLTKQLEARGVTVILGESLNTVAAEAGVYTTDKGRRIQADAMIVAYGGTPNTAYLRESMPNALDAGGRVRVNAHLQLEQHPNIFALGDITNVQEAKMAITAGAHAKVVAHNLKALRDSKPLKSYAPAKVPMALVPLGPKGGAGQLPFGAGVIVTFLAPLKGRALMTEQFKSMIADS
jgi:apoptosis-inducing factor 2